MSTATKTTSVWRIRDADGETHALHVRFDHPDGKECRWRLPGADGWGLDGRKVATLPLYGSELVPRWPEGATAVVVEGEKATDALLSAGFHALGTVTGASGTPGPEAVSVLEGFEVILWPDNDEQGYTHMERVAKALRGVAASVSVFTWRDAPEKGDAADHPAIVSLEAEALDRLLQDLLEAPRWVSRVSPSSNKAVSSVTPLRFADMTPPGPRAYRVKGIVPDGHTTTIFGDGGSAKSVLALSAATALAGGAQRWLGREVRPCPVLFVDLELDADEQRRRAYQVARGVSLDKPPRDLLYVSGLGRPASEVLEGCLEECAKHGIGVLILDSLGIALEGDAGDARDVIRFHHRYLDPFRSAGITLLVVDHQGKTQAGERYQNKRTFGSVYKENLARSVLQVEPADRGDGLLTLKLRQTKHNFGPKAEPFGVRLTFSEKEITVGEQPLDATELAGEGTLNAGDRVLLTLRDGPAYPADVSEACGMPLGTVKNELTRLRKRGLVEYTGEVQGQARQVRLTTDGRGVTGVTRILEDCDAVTPSDETLVGVYVNDE